MPEPISIKTGPNLSILVVHNESLIRDRIRKTLENVGCERVMTVESSRKALSVLRTQSIELLICDIDLDELDGWRISRLVRSGALRCRAETPIIVTTSTWCERIAEITAREHGINALIPIDDLETIPFTVESCVNEGYSLTKPQLLVVEDDEDTAELIKRVLHSRFDIEVAYDGEAGLNAWIARRHDLVLLDVMLPIMEGPEVLKGIMDKKANQPVIIMTAHAPVEQAEELLINGAADFIPKPFRPEQLRSIAEVALRRDDYLVSNNQFAERVRSLAEREAAYREVSETHKHLLNNLQTVVMELDADLNITFLNDAWTFLFGFSVVESLNKPFKDFLSSQDGRKHRAIDARFNAVLSGDKDSCDLELELLDVNHDLRWAHLRVSRSVNLHQTPRLTICLDDITHRRQAQEQLEYLAMHDALTGLNNRYFFESTLEKLAKSSLENNQQHGLIYLDLDYFKVINDTHGHHRGDEVLRQVSTLIRENIREDDVLCRFGGDEFAIILHDISLDKVKDIAEKIKDTIGNHRFQIDKRSVDLGCSIGICAIDGSVDDSEGYMVQADIALYVAKHRGRNSVHLYNPEDQESDELRRNLDWARQLRLAIKEDRLVLYFQPIVDISRNQVSYYEALLRMLDENGNLIMPGKFIGALESTGEMALLDRWVIKNAIRMLSDHDELKNIAINLSAQAFRDENLVPVIRESLSDAGVDGSAITFELTESASLLNIETTQRVISELHSLGCSFAIDDFGSGFSSFAYLKKLPADYIKLDGSFIRNLHQDKVDQALVRSIIEVVQTLGRKTVAEFVENKEILQFLRDNGVDYAQGYYVGRPMPVEKLATAKENY
jgi:diguanylate cyclase (GGDEF)-like protein/PAS domain S-box-containing protein